MRCVVMTEENLEEKSSKDNAIYRHDAKKTEEGIFVSKNTMKYKQNFPIVQSALLYC